jgi:hypothetical protein
MIKLAMLPATNITAKKVRTKSSFLFTFLFYRSYRKNFCICQIKATHPRRTRAVPMIAMIDMSGVGWMMAVPAIIGQSYGTPASIAILVKHKKCHFLFLMSIQKDTAANAPFFYTRINLAQLFPNDLPGQDMHCYLFYLFPIP